MSFDPAEGTLARSLDASKPAGSHELRSWADTLPPLTLAFVGDGVFDLVIRTMVVTAGKDRPVKKLHKEKADRVNARAQAALTKAIAPLLTDEEAAILKRGRNTHSNTVPKNQSVTDYRLATGLEALCGYLYMKGEMARLLDLIKAGLG